MRIFLALFFSLLLLACNPPKEGSNALSVKWNQEVENFLQDSIAVNPIVDSLKHKILKAGNDTVAIDLLCDLSENLKGKQSLLMADEAFRQSQLIHYASGIGNANCYRAAYFYKTDNYERGDSILNSYINKPAPLKVKAQALSFYAESRAMQGDYDQALEKFKEAEQLALIINDKDRLAYCYTKLGDVSRMKDENSESIRYSQLAVPLAIEQHKKTYLAACYFSMGSVYMMQGDYSKAIDNFNNSIIIAREIEDKKRISKAMVTMGEVYRQQHNNKKAISYFLQALPILKEINNRSYEAYCLSVLGEVYHEISETEKALECAYEAIAISKEINDKPREAYSLITLGHIYREKNDYPKALEQFDQALQLGKEVEDKTTIIFCQHNKAETFYQLKNYAGAIELASECLRGSQAIDFTEGVRFSSETLYKAYQQTKNFQKAFEMHLLYTQIKDSLINTEQVKKFASMEYKVKEDELVINQAKKDLQHEAEQYKKEEEIKRQKVLRNTLIAGAILLLLFSVFIFRSLKKSQQARRTIAEQKKLVEEQKHVMEEQKEIVEEKQKEIIDSINYAKRIQTALLANDKLLSDNLPEHFVLFKPKDIVAGDFYWGTATSDGFIYVTADCTGHGVPGAFMSLLNISKLNEAINQKNIVRPDLIFNEVRKEIIAALNPEGSLEESKDGMDAVLCKLDLKNMRLEFAGANNSFYIIRDKEILICRADKIPVGKGHDSDGLFTYNEIGLHKGDMIFTFTDGYADQFGGPKGKKFKYKQMEDIMISIAELPMAEQKHILDQRLEEWKGNLEQVDDICIIGVRV